MNDIRVRRVYRAPEDADGARVLVDRLWPRGLAKNKAELTEWCKDIAPSSALRTWYGHDPERFEEFDRRYRRELEEPERVDGCAGWTSWLVVAGSPCSPVQRIPVSVRPRCLPTCYAGEPPWDVGTP